MGGQSSALLRWDAWLRAIGAIALLAAGLAGPWHFAGSSADVTRGYLVGGIVAATAGSLLCLVVVLIARTTPVGSGTRRLATWVRALSALGYIAVVCTVLLADARAGMTWYHNGGVGIGAAFGLAGALLAAVPARVDVSQDGQPGTTARVLASSAAGFWAAMTLVTQWACVDFAKDLGEATDQDVSTTWATQTTVQAAVLACLLVVAASRLAHASAAARVALMIIGGAFCLATVWSWTQDWRFGPVFGMESMRSRVFLVMPVLMIAALASSPRLDGSAMPPETSRVRAQAAQGLLGVAACWAALEATASWFWSPSPVLTPADVLRDTALYGAVAAAAALGALLLRWERRGALLAALLAGIVATACGLVEVATTMHLLGGKDSLSALVDYGPGLETIAAVGVLPVAASVLVALAMRAPEAAVPAAHLPAWQPPPQAAWQANAVRAAGTSAPVAPPVPGQVWRP